ncbi:MAG: branched-chain amino acid aminotransferase [bacterium]|nr:branched-chain amino acid aminotransferase [bacterium]
MDVKFIKIPDNELKPKPSKDEVLGFGKTFTDYMFQMNYSPEKGWHDPVIKKLEDFSLSPAVMVFHYSQEIFEGLKGYLRADGKIGLFRAIENFKRMNRSAERICMPTIPVEDQQQAVEELLKIEKDWFPDKDSGSMYIRPTMIGTDPYLGVKESSNYIYYVILSPSGFYFKGGPQPVKVYVTDKYVRAAIGGVGTAKTGGNYAASLLAGKEARDKGCDQVLWLDAKHNKYVEEVGAMNICFVMNGKTVVTSQLNGAILEGVTRDSAIALCKKLGYEVEERPISIDEVLEKIETGEITECFGCGTAAVISPVGKFLYKDKWYNVSDEPGPISQQLYTELTGIQWGIKEDGFGWTKVVD